MPFLHLPVQSGSDRVLAAMNRRHTAADYLALVDRLRAARPDIALSSDFIVGHPGETDADFQATLDLVRRVGFAQAFSFKYSPRPGTPAASAPNQVPEAVKDARLQELLALLRAQQAAFNRNSRGPDAAGAVHRARPQARPALRPHALSAARPCSRPTRADRHGSPRANRARTPQLSHWNPRIGEDCPLEHDRRCSGCHRHDDSPWQGGHPAIRRQCAVAPAVRRPRPQPRPARTGAGRAHVVARQPGGDHRRAGPGAGGGAGAERAVQAAGDRQGRLARRRGHGDPHGRCRPAATMATRACRSPTCRRS